MSEYFPSDIFLAAVEARYDDFRAEALSSGDKGLVTNIQKGAAAIKTEFSRLEAIYKVPGKKPEDLYIPHEEKEKLFSLATDLAALCRMLTERTVPGRSRQLRLTDLPENCIAIREGGETKVLNEEDTRKVMGVIASAIKGMQAVKEGRAEIVDFEAMAARKNVERQKVLDEVHEYLGTDPATAVAEKKLVAGGISSLSEADKKALVADNKATAKVKK